MTITLAEQDALNRERLEKQDFNKNFLVSAGAGAGKTYITVERVFNMLSDPSTGILPQNIVMITMTIRAANEMKERLSSKLRKEVENCTDPEKQNRLQMLLDTLPEMQISTIHSFCRRILNDYPLESGVGFAPQYDNEDSELKSSALNIWAEKAWKQNRFPECVRLDIKKDVALNNLKTLCSFPTVIPQFEDPDVPANSEDFSAVVNECRRLIRGFYESMDDMDPNLLNYKIRDAILSGDDMTDGMAVKAVRQFSKNIDDLYWWMGKTKKQAKNAYSDGLSILMNLPDTYEYSQQELDAMEQVLLAGAGLKYDDRRSAIVANIGMLPEGFREVARMVENLSDPDELNDLTDRIDRMMHGTITKELYSLSKEYEAERHANHIVTLADMLIRAAALVRDYPEVRQKLHERYKVFFVDEYQDTNPVQTELIFAIAADNYHPDWHCSMPAPGSLFLVGDAKQGIYRFTGADITLWHEAVEVMQHTGGEVVPLSRNFRSTPEICSSVTDVFGSAGDLKMENNDYQVEFQPMVSGRDSGPVPAYHHVIPCYESGRIPGQEADALPLTDPLYEAAKQVALYIRNRVDQEGKEYGDFLVLSYNKEKSGAYAEAFREYNIPVKYDGELCMDFYPPIKLLNLRVQAVSHPFDERLSVRVLCECAGIMIQEWDLFRMNLKTLPKETGLTVFRDPRSLMDHVEELEQLLPDTEMNRNILKGLKMLNEDRVLSQHRDPCAFLDELAEKSEGLFREEYDAEQYQNQYAALRHVIDYIRAQNPQHFDEMAEMLEAMVESKLERMPTVRADNNYVRLMNLHKVKGLEGKIVIYIPSRLPLIGADQYIRREGTIAKGWFPIKPVERGKGTTFNPPDWKELSTIEKEFQKAERTRLRYVGLTRAADEVHFFDYLTDENVKAPRNEKAWKGFEGIGNTIPEIEPDPDQDGIEREDESLDAILAERDSVVVGLPIVREKHSARRTPSEIDKEYGEADDLKVEDADDTDPEEAQDPDNTPGGKDWGSSVHRAAELIVNEGIFTQERISAAAIQAVTEQFDSELLSKQERNNLQLPEDRIALEEIRAWLAEQIAQRLAFMADETSSFRKLLQDVEAHTEMSFVITVKPEDKEIYLKLAGLMNIDGGKRLEVHGKIDLALRYPDGSWIIADYKTDRMKPSDLGSRENFEARLKREYGRQLEIYKVVLEYLTEETVKETKLLSV